QGKNAEAIAQLQKASNAAPGFAPARYFLGVAYAQDLKRDQAESEWTETLRIDSNFMQAALGLARLKLMLQQPDRAIRYAQDVLKIDPASSDALLVLGNAHMARRDFGSAVKVFERLVQQRPGYAVALERLGFAYVALEKYAKAETYLTEA